MKENVLRRSHRCRQRSTDILLPAMRAQDQHHSLPYRRYSLRSSCLSVFIEEYQNPKHIRLIFLGPTLSTFISHFFLPSTSTHVVLQNPRSDTSRESLFGFALDDCQSIIGSDAFDSITYLTSLLASQRANGINYQFVFGNQPGTEIVEAWDGL